MSLWALVSVQYSSAGERSHVIIANKRADRWKERQDGCLVIIIIIIIIHKYYIAPISVHSKGLCLSENVHVL